MTDKVKVRAIRPHDTTDGIRQPGEEYDRTAADAKLLTTSGIAEAVTAKPAAKRTAKRK